MKNIFSLLFGITILSTATIMSNNPPVTLSYPSNPLENNIEANKLFVATEHLPTNILPVQDYILITGGAGYIGSHIAYYFAQKNCKVIILDIKKPEFDYQWATFIEGNYGDVSLLDEIFTKFAIKTVVHCGAWAQVNQSINNPLEYYDNNVGKTVTLLQGMLRHTINQFVFSSSCAVYGIPQGPLTEEHEFNPISPYGKTKRIVEQVLEDIAHANKQFSYICLRYFNAAGALPERNLGERHEPETHCIPLALKAALEQKPFTVFGTDYPTPDGTCVRDYVHVLDIAHAHYQALRYLENTNACACINLVTGNVYSVQEIISAINKITSVEIPVIYGNRREGDPAYLVAQSAKAATLLAWQPQQSDLESIISSAYEFMITRDNTIQ